MTWTTENIHRIIMTSWILLPAQPTPVVLAASACHVIASRYFLNTRLTFRAISNVTVICSPPKELLIDVSVTLSTVPSLPALKTHWIAAFTISTIVLSFCHKPVAVRSCAPFEVWICVNINVFLKLKVLLEDLLRAELPYIFSCVLSSTVSICTFNPIDFSIRNIVRYIVSHAIQAETMVATFHTMKIFFMIVLIAYFTSSPAFSHRLHLSLTCCFKFYALISNYLDFRVSLKKIINLFLKLLVRLYSHQVRGFGDNSVSLLLMVHGIATTHLTELCEGVFGEFMYPSTVSFGSQKFRSMIHIFYLVFTFE